MDFKDILLLLAKIFDNEKIKEIAEGIKDNDTAISDDVAKDLEESVNESMESYMSMEAAQNNPKLEKFYKTKLFPALKGEILGNIDTELDGIAASMFSTEVAQQILSEENTKNKLRLFNDNAEKILKKRMPDDESKKKLEELTKKYNDSQATWEEQLKSKEREVEAEKLKVHDTLIKSKVNEMAKSYRWRESLADETVQPVLLDKVYQKLKSQATFKYNEAGEIEVFDKENPETLLYQGNKKISVKDLLDKEIDPYLDKAPAKKTPVERPRELNKANGDVQNMRERIEAGRTEFQNKTY